MVKRPGIDKPEVRSGGWIAIIRIRGECRDGRERARVWQNAGALVGLFPMGFIQRRVLMMVLRVVERPRLSLAIAGLALLACVGMALAHLRVSTDQDKLFAADVPFFHNYLDFVSKFPENEAIFCVIEPKVDNDGHEISQPVAQWTALADAIVHRLNGMPKYIKSAEAKVPLEQLGPQAVLFQPISQTRSDMEQFAVLSRLWGERPNWLVSQVAPTPMQRFLVGLNTQPPTDESATFVRTLAHSWNATLQSPTIAPTANKSVVDLAEAGATDPSKLGYFYERDESDFSRHVLLVQIHKVEDTGTFETLTALSDVVDAIRGAVADVAKQYPQFDVGLTGRPVLDADEMRTTDHDSNISEIVALSVVFVGMVIFFRSVWLAFAAEIALAVGIGWTFGWATISIGELNLLSLVFLIALIGIGMDYLVQILSRYRREARRYTRPKAIWTRVFRYVSAPVATACLGAAGAFFVSIFTEFKGASELGVIAGGGLLLCLLSGYTVLPALLTIFPPKIQQIEPSERYNPQLPEAGGYRLALPLIWCCGLIAAACFIDRLGFNPNLLDLQAPNLDSVQLVRKLQTWSAVVLSKDLDMLRKVRDAVRPSPLVASTDSFLEAVDNYRWLQDHKSQLPTVNWTTPTPIRPADLPALAQAADVASRRFAESTSASSTPRIFSDASAALADFAAALKNPQNADEAARRLSFWQDQFVAELREAMTAFSPPPPDVNALPDELKSHLVSADGTYALYINPAEDLWKREPLTRFEVDVEKRAATVPGAPPVTGIASDIYHTTQAIQVAFYEATGYALALVFILVLIDLRNLSHTLMAVSVLLLGLPMLAGLMGLFHVEWNMANFFGLPILIGAGHEYGVFMVHRYREVLDNPRRSWQRWDVSDRALLLCGFITSSSFGFFWALGHHQGLRSLGLVMALGTACIYLATVMVVRPLLRWRLQMKKVYHRRDLARRWRLVRHEAPQTPV
jgi:predicted RND superfamily exporter protein